MSAAETKVETEEDLIQVSYSGPSGVTFLDYKYGIVLCIYIIVVYASYAVG